MKLLDQEIIKTQDGVRYKYSQVSRQKIESKVIYVYKIEHVESERLVGHEVFIAKQQLKDIVMPTKSKSGENYVSPAGEKYPGNNDFGQTAYHIGGVIKDNEQLIEQYTQLLIDKVINSKNKKSKKDAKDND